MAEKLAIWTLVRNLGYCDEVVRIAIDKINKFIKGDGYEAWEIRVYDG